jgi:gliding motility-associated-like protein
LPGRSFLYILFRLASVFRTRSLCIIFILIASNTLAQDCPSNIDFEQGSFANWQCHTGSVSAGTGQNVISLSPSGGPSGDQHTMFSRSSGGVDYYGGFPVTCPNGSGYSVKLGNTSGGAQAEGLSYEFTIPSNRNTYSLIYHYAVVFQDPNHQEFQQPRLELEIMNMTDNELIDCSSFTFIPNGSSLPGFFQSPNSDSTAVWCKDWSAVSINLNGKAGKTIRLFFKTADCTFRRHFGYAYIDVNTECSSEFTGATYCPDDTAVTVTGPYGYQSYTWYNQNFTQVIGTGQTLYLSPPPPVGTTVAVTVEPYSGYGCSDTLYADLIDTLKLKANAGNDAIYCNQSPVTLGTIPKAGVIYQWRPTVGLSDPNISNPLASPIVNTEYILTVRSTGGGCVNEDTVLIESLYIDSTMQFIGKRAFCITSGDSAVFLVQPTDSIQWYRNGNAINGATRTRFRATQSGTYHAVLFGKGNCQTETRREQITIEIPRQPIVYPVQYAVINIPIQLQARTFGVEVLWRPPIYLNSTSVETPDFKAPAELEQLYVVDITTAGGCTTTDTQLVKGIKEVKIYIPSAFTPNNDGLNDLLRPIMLGIKQFHYFRIYNRWGQLVYDMPSEHRGWDGRLGNHLQQTGVFVWMFSGIGADNKLHTQKGTVVLIR